MDQKTVNFNFSAPYFTIGSLNQNTSTIWLIFHGYGQLAAEFSSAFSILRNKKNYLIFPQGLSKFYLKGISNKVGANWMTSDDREIDIKNYITYLDQLFECEVKSLETEIKVNILGFSQGGHTASRWICNSKISYNKLILWGSNLAQEINKQMVMVSLTAGKNIVVLGDEDKYINDHHLEIIKKRYSRIGFNYELIEYHGGHDIYPEVLKQLI